MNYLEVKISKTLYLFKFCSRCGEEVFYIKCLRCCFNLVLDAPSKEAPIKKSLMQSLLQPIPYYRLISKFEIKIHFLLAAISIQFSLFRCRQPFLESLWQPSKEDTNIYIYTEY